MGYVWLGQQRFSIIRNEQFDINSWDQDIELEELNDINATIVDYIKAGKTNTEIRNLMGDGVNQQWNVKNPELSLYRQYLDVLDTQVDGGKFSHVSFKDTPEELAMLTVADGLIVYDIDTRKRQQHSDIDDYGDLGSTVDWTAGGPTITENGKVVVDEGLIHSTW